VTECAGPDWLNDPTTDEESRDYAYFGKDGRLPRECDFGAPVSAAIRSHVLQVQS
jgi:hypothetical protein